MTEDASSGLTSHTAPPTLTDVARAAGVSTASVSRALTRPELVSEHLRVRVSEAAAALGYVANVSARALVRRRSGLIGVIAGDFDQPGVAPALAALDARLGDAGFALLVGNCGKDATPVDRARLLLGRGVEALVFVGVAVPTELAAVNGIRTLPCVSVDRTDTTGFAASAGLDLARAGKLIADYLAQLGHRRLAIVAEPSCPIGTLLEDALRVDSPSAGYTLMRLGVGAEPVAGAILEWIAQPDSPTAAICGSDAVALAVMHACASHAVVIPRQLSVVGFGDSPLARCLSPTLTSVRIPARAAGVAAANYLIAHFEGRSPDPAHLAVKLAVRATTGAPDRTP